MNHRRRSGISTIRMTCAIVLLLAGVAAPGASGNVVNGRVTDAANLPVAGYRVVFRPAASDEVVFSEPTDADGRYAALLQPGMRYMPFALVADTGRRIELAPTPPAAFEPGEVLDIQLDFDVPEEPIRVPQMYRGSDRLFLSFVEDTVVTDWLRFEGQVDISDYGSADARVTHFIAAAQIPGLPDAEFGGRIGYGGIDLPGSMTDRGGISDLDLWARLTVPAGSAGRPDFAFGGIVTVPLSDSGLGYDAGRSKIFGAARFHLVTGVLSVHAGVRFNENGSLDGSTFNGAVAGALGLAYVRPLSWDARVTLIAEATYEGERFEGGEPDARALVGINWKAFENGALRFAAAAGLTDGAPDSQLILGYTFDF